jgi:hypothetical protein
MPLQIVAYKADWLGSTMQSDVEAFLAAFLAAARSSLFIL